jgi:branched-chain amino acid transport system substrate-binding protein
MRTRWLWMVVLVAVIVSLAVVMMAGCAKPGPAKPTGAPYRIGALFAVSGPASPLGVPERNTALLLQEEINKAGGINGHPLEILIEDTASEESRTALAANKLLDSDVLAIVGPSQSGETLAIIDRMQKAQVPLISCAASVKITQPVADRKWIFKTPQSDAMAIEKLIDYMKAHKMKRVGFIYVSNAFGESGREQAEKLLPKAGITIAATQSFGPEDTVMTTQLTQLAAAKPDAIICWGTNPGPARIAQAMHDMGLKIPLLQSHGVANRTFINLAGAGAEGVVLPAGRLIVASQIPDSDPQKQILLQYTKAYEDKFHEAPDTFGGHAWDAIELVVKALRAVGPDRAKIRDYIENTRGFVGIGGVFNFSKDDHNGLTKDAFVMVRIEKGQWKLAE